MRGLCRLLVTFSLALYLCGTAWAVLLTDAQMFYDPWQVPAGNYPVIDLRTTWDGTQVGNNSVAWPQFPDVQNVQVLPLLKPHPGPEPAQYPQGYHFTQDDYEYQPNVHYWVDLTTGTARATFVRPGIFHVKLDRVVDPDPVFAVFVDSGLLDGAASGASVKIDGPKADLVVVSSPSTPNKVLDNAAANAADDNGSKKVKRAGNAQDCIDQITVAAQAAGRKIHVELVAHGNQGVFMMGDTMVGGPGMSMADFQKAIDRYVKELSVYACNFAAGTAGAAAVNTLAKSIGSAYGFTGYVSVHRSDWWGWLVGGSWDLELNRSLYRVTYLCCEEVAQAKAAPDGANVSLTTPAVVTANLGTCLYVESPNRTSGIRVESTEPICHTGMHCLVAGVMGTTENGERYIDATDIEFTGMMEPVPEVMMTVSHLGGGEFGLQKATGGGVGLSNVGMLVSTAGRVVEMDPTTQSCRISDGGIFGESVKVVLPMTIPPPPMMQMVRVTGVVSCETQDMRIQPVLLVREPTDIRIYPAW